MIQIRSKRIIDEYHGFSFSRSSMAQDQKGKLYYPNNARFLQGKFGKAVLVEEGTTNLNSDPFFKTGVSGWGKGNWTTLEWLSSEYNPFSKQNGVMRLYDNNGTNRLCLKAVSISNTPHTVSVLLKILKGNINRTNVGGTINYTDSTYTDYTWNNSNTTRYDMSAIYGQGVYKLVATITPNSSKTISKYEIRISHNNAVETELFVYAVQLEAKPYNTSFIDGTRAAETLTIPTAGVLNPQEGTVECWVYVNDLIKNTATNRYIFAHTTSIGSPYPNCLRLYHSINNQWVLNSSNGAGQASNLVVPDTLPVGWHHFTVRWSSSELALFIDGVKVDYIVNSYLPEALANNIYFGRWVDGTYGFINSLIDDLRISNIARSDEEILAAYESNQPLPVDQYTTLKLGFDGPDGQRGTAIVTF